MNKKDIIKIIIVIILIGAIGFETFYFLKSNKSTEEEIIEQPQDEDLTKYIVDVTKPYYMNGIKLELNEEGGYFYHKVSGLKNTKIQDKINAAIKEKVKNVYEKIGKDSNEKITITSSIAINYSNILGITVTKGDGEPTMENAEFYAEASGYDMQDSIMFDLNTGRELSIADIVISEESIKEQITYAAEEYITKSIGFEFAHFGGLSDSYKPDYSKVEDSVLSVVNQFKKGNYSMAVNYSEVSFRIKDVYMHIPIICEEDHETEKCKKFRYYHDDEENEDYYVYVDQNNIDTEIYLTIPFLKIKDNLVLYNRFEQGNDLYENERQKQPRVFAYDRSNFFELASYISSDDEEHIDYEIDYTYMYDEETEVPYKKIKESVIKESKELQTKNYNVYTYDGTISVIGADRTDSSRKSYYYVYFDVTHYDLPKEKYDTLKEKLYIAKYDRAYNDFGAYYFDKTRFNFMKSYSPKKANYFYIYDDKGKEMSCSEIINQNFDFQSYIPANWLTLGKYKTVKDLVKNAYFTVSDSFNVKDRLVILDKEYSETIVLKYKGKKVTVCDSYEVCDELRKELFN